MSRRRVLARILAVVTLLAQLAMLRRLLVSARQRLAWRFPPVGETASVAVIVPVHNEQGRLAPCLEGLIQQPPFVEEILVVDTGSTDRTARLVAAYQRRDRRVRFLEAGDPPDGWNGKVWALAEGLSALDRDTEWIAVIDADVRPAATLVERLLLAAKAAHVPCASVALLQAPMPDALSWIVHPSMLASLVYRCGMPHRVFRSPQRLLFNGQAMLLHRSVLPFLGGFRDLAFTNAEDIALARTLTARGIPVALFEALDDSFVTMYGDGRETWQNWPRSLPLQDGTSRCQRMLELGELVATQGAWLPLLVLAAVEPTVRLPAWLAALSRAGIAFGMRRAYRQKRWWYWLSPLADPFVVARIVSAAATRSPRWHGRHIALGGARCVGNT